MEPFSNILLPDTLATGHSTNKLGRKWDRLGRLGYKLGYMRLNPISPEFFFFFFFTQGKPNQTRFHLHIQKLVPQTNSDQLKHQLSSNTVRLIIITPVVMMYCSVA